MVHFCGKLYVEWLSKWSMGQLSLVENTDFSAAHSQHLVVGLVDDFPYFLEVCKGLMGASSLLGVLVLSRFVQSFGVEDFGFLGASEGHIIAWVLLPLVAHSSCLEFSFLLGDHMMYVAGYSPVGYNPDLAVVEYIKPLWSFPCMQATLGAHIILSGWEGCKFW